MRDRPPFGRCGGQRWRATKTAGRELGISSRPAFASIGKATSTADEIAEHIEAQPSRGPWSAPHAPHLPARPPTGHDRSSRSIATHPEPRPRT